MAKIEQEKTHVELGYAVRDYLVEMGVETPMVENNDSDATKRCHIEDAIENIMKTLGLDMSDDSLRDTPVRVAKMYVNEVFSGLDYGNFPKATVVDNKMGFDSMVLCKDIAVFSTCEHHLAPFHGVCKVAYIPGKKVLGLSKINRIVKFFAQRPQIQERLIMQIYYALSCILDTENIAVTINASHMCVSMRGVEDVGSSTSTTKLGGLFKLCDSTKREFLTA